MFQKKAHTMLFTSCVYVAQKETFRFHAVMVNLFPFVHCALFAGGKCQEIIQAGKLMFNDCHLLAVVLLSWGKCNV